MPSATSAEKRRARFKGLMNLINVKGVNYGRIAS